MNLDLAPEEAYRELVARAEAYFLRVFPIRADERRPFGVQRWLNDLEDTRTRELVEAQVEREDWRKRGRDLYGDPEDVPL